MIVKYNICASNLGLFILSHAFVPFKQSIELIPFFGQFYSLFDYLNIVKYKKNISQYNMHMNGYGYGKFNKKKPLYIDDHP